MSSQIHVKKPDVKKVFDKLFETIIKPAIVKQQFGFFEKNKIIKEEKKGMKDMLKEYNLNKNITDYNDCEYIINRYILLNYVASYDTLENNEKKKLYKTIIEELYEKSKQLLQDEKKEEYEEHHNSEIENIINSPVIIPGITPENTPEPKSSSKKSSHKGGKSKKKNKINISKRKSFRKKKVYN